MSINIDCPSGLKLRIRGLKGKEGRLLTDRLAMRQGMIIDNILNACTEEVLDPGPYEVGADGKFDWNKALLGDRYFTFVKIRIACFGPEYGFSVQCGETNCRQRFEWEINLETDLTVRTLSEEDRLVVANNGLFEASLSDGRVARYRLATGVDEKAMARKRSQEQALSEMLASRIVSLDGVEEPSQHDAANQRVMRNIRATLDDMEWSELVEILSQLDEHDCGIDPKIEIECPSCGGQQEINLPFEKTFLLPTEKTKTRGTQQP